MSAPLGLAPLAPADGVRAVAGVLALILAPLLAVILVGAVWLGSWLGGAGGRPDGLPAVPPAHLVVMQQVADEYGVPWALLAAIASVESGFGANMATSWAGAIGYGQFLPSSWAAFGAGGDPYDYRDAIPAMARYLVAAGAPGDLPAAVYAYNHSWAYVAEVLGRMTAYASLGPDPASVSPATAPTAPTAVAP